ncbi:MAG TPA: isoprenylcysteine carboxylmethyltransferase family protein, partial [Thermoanaerobaculia bacterium]|nr:isoprenylcysteine carboxylmethyltransferase family protein [Thermoanaerobaculia bacterium]
LEPAAGLHQPAGAGSDSAVWPPAGAQLYAFHVLFFAVFVPRWLLRWWHAVGGRFSSRQDTPMTVAGSEMGRQRSTARARGSQVPLFLHVLAAGVLYFGIARAVLVPPAAADPYLFPPQRAAGASLMLAASVLAAWALAVFRSWRLAARIELGHELCTTGPFRWVRHPIYLAMDLLALGSWLWAPTATVALGVVLMALTGDLRARTEERLLCDTFGQAYETYLRQARRFVPGIY